MKLPRSKHDTIDAISKFIGLVLLAVSIDNVSKGNYYLALFFFCLGAIIGIVPIFIEVETPA
jgi:uncharacterized membrane protein YqgA involved in biofilm formation